MKVNNETNNLNQKEIIDQTKEMAEQPKVLELILDDIFENNKSSSVLSDKKVLEKYINLKDKKLTDNEWAKLFAKIKYKSGFDNSFSFKVADKLNVIHDTKHEDVQREIETIENFINSQEKNIKLIHKQLNINFSAKAQKDIQNLAKGNIREAYSQIDSLLELAQDIVFNIEVDWYYNKIYNNLSLDWFVKSPSFNNPNVINKIVIDDENNIDEIQTQYVESNLFAEFDSSENVELFTKTLNVFISNFNAKILEKEVIDLIFEKYINYLLEKVNNINLSTISILDSIILSMTNKNLLAHAKKIHSETIKYNTKFNKCFSKYEVSTINNKFFKQTETILNVINDLSLSNKNLELFINQTIDFDHNTLSDDLQKEISFIKFEDDNLTDDEILIEKLKRYFLQKTDENIVEYQNVYSLVKTILFYAKYIKVQTIDKKKNKAKKDVSESVFVYENTKQTFANEVKRFRYTSEEVQALYNEITNFDESVFKENLFSGTNIFYLNESISKLFIILDYIYKSLRITLKRSREINIKVDIDKKHKRIIEDNIEKSEYYLELLYKQFGALNNKYDTKNFRSIDICINTAKNLLVSFSDFVSSSEEFESLTQFKDLIVQDSEMIKQTLLVFRAMLSIVKEHKNDVHYGISTLSVTSKKLVDEKNKIEMAYTNIDGNSQVCTNCKELHAENYFEESLLVDYKNNSIQFKKIVKRIINDALRIRKNNVSSLDAQKYIFNKLMEVISIENGIVKHLSFVSDAVGSQISAIMLKNIFNKSSYLVDTSNNNPTDNLKKYASILTNNLLILKFSAVRLLILKNLQYHLFLLDKLENELKALTPSLSTFDSLLKFNLEKIHDLSILVKEAKLDSQYKNDRKINYLYCEFVKAGLLPDINNINEISEKSKEIIKKLFPETSINKFAQNQENNQSNDIVGSTVINNISGESIEITYFDNKNPVKEPVTYHELLNSSRVNLIDDVKIVDIQKFDESLLNKKDNYLDQLDNVQNSENPSFKDQLEASRVKDDFVCGMFDLYEVKDVWKPSDFNMTMPKYTPTTTATVAKKPFGFAKKVVK